MLARAVVAALVVFLGLLLGFALALLLVSWGFSPGFLVSAVCVWGGAPPPSLPLLVVPLVLLSDTWCADPRGRFAAFFSSLVFFAAVALLDGFFSRAAVALLDGFFSRAAVALLDGFFSRAAVALLNGFFSRAPVALLGGFFSRALVATVLPYERHLSCNLKPTVT